MPFVETMTGRERVMNALAGKAGGSPPGLQSDQRRHRGTHGFGGRSISGCVP